MKVLEIYKTQNTHTTHIQLLNAISFSLSIDIFNNSLNICYQTMLTELIHFKDIVFMILVLFSIC